MKKISYLILIGLFLFSVPTPVHSSALDGAVIQGFNLEKIEHGSKAYSIKAQKATFGSKRIAFFNINLIKVINLEGVDFDLYSQGELVKAQHFDQAVFELNTGRLLDKDGELIFRE